MKIFVAKLDYAVQDDDLSNAFSQYGEVASANVIMDKISGRSRGFGFIEMNNDNEAQTAIAELDGTDLQGRTIVVKQAEDRKERKPQRRDDRW
jgi:RNA recognition motif-containing protein